MKKTSKGNQPVESKTSPVFEIMPHVYNNLLALRRQTESPFALNGELTDKSRRLIYRPVALAWRQRPELCPFGLGPAATSPALARVVCE